MADILTPRPASVQVPRASDDDDVTHSWCCDFNTAICGEDITDATITRDPDALVCVVCEDPDLPCARCGEDGWL